MKMLKNGHEVDASVTSRTPILSLPSTKRGVVPRCAARPPEPPAQVHPDHHAEAGAVVVAVAADGAEPVDEEAVLPKKGIKTVTFLPSSQKMRWVLDANANAGRHDGDPPNDDDV